MMFELWRNLGWSFLAGLSLKNSRGLTLGEQKGVEEFEVQDFPLIYLSSAAELVERIEIAVQAKVI